MRKPRFMHILIVVIISLVVICGVLHWVAGHRAKKAYRGSRTHLTTTPGSYDFITMGITANMHEDQVNEIMKEATEKMLHMRQGSPPWDEYVNIYDFLHGQKWRSPILREEKMLKERFAVYFDPNGLAVRIERDLYPFYGRFEVWEIDLASKKVVKGDRSALHD